MGFARSDRATPAEPSLPLRPRRAACTPNAASRPTTFPPTPACRRAPLGWGPTAQGQLEAAAAIRGHAISPTDAAYEYTVDRHRPPGAGFPLSSPRIMRFCANDSAWNGGMGCWRCDQHAFLQATATCVEGLPARIQCLPHALLSTSIRREGRLAPPVIACASRGRGRGLECRCPLRHTRVSFNLYVTVVGGHHRVRRISTLQSGPREAHPSQE